MTTQLRKVAVVAIGGNSLIKDDKHQTVEDQYRGRQGDHLSHRRHDRGGLGCRHRPRQRAAGRLHPAPLGDRGQGRGHARGAAGRVRRGQPGRHRLRAPADPPELAVPARHQQERRDRHHPGAGGPQRSGLQEPHEAHRRLHGRGRSQAPRGGDGLDAWSKTPAAAGAVWWPRRCPRKSSSWTPSRR